MGAISDAINAWLRSYVVDGLPSSGANEPSKAEGRAVGLLLEDPANFGVVNAADAATINSTQTIANSFPAAYNIVDAGSPADLVITLPAGAGVGSLVWFRVSILATKLFTIYDSGTDMEGEDRLIMWAGESVMLLKESTGWKRVGGVKRPLHGTLRRTSSLSLTSAVAANVTFAALVGNQQGLSHCLNSGRFLPVRAGIYAVTFVVSTTGSGAGELSQAKLTISGGTVTHAAPALSQQYGISGSPRLTHNISGVFALERVGGEVIPSVYVVGTTPAVEYSAGSIECQLQFQEIIS